MASRDPTRTPSPASRSVASEMSTCPPTVKDSMRPAWFTALPTTPYFVRRSEPMLPTMTWPVWTATPISSRGSPSASFLRLSSWMAACISTAHWTARRASSSRARGAPKMARIASPTNSSIVPWWDRITSAIAPRYELRSRSTWSGESPSVSGVKPRRSDMSSVTFFCSPPSRGPSGVARSPATTSSLR